MYVCVCVCVCAYFGIASYSYIFTGFQCCSGLIINNT